MTKNPEMSKKRFDLDATYPGLEIMKKCAKIGIFLCLHTILMLFIRSVVGKKVIHLNAWLKMAQSLICQLLFGHLVSCLLALKGVDVALAAFF